MQTTKEVRRPFVQPLRKSHIGLERPPFECVALLLQGGGALGAYQAGVYQALAEANLHPDWVAGISIGAINAALIAGNAPKERREAARVLGRDHHAAHLRSPRLAHYWLRGDMGHVFLNGCAPAPRCSRVLPASSPRDSPPYLAPPGTVEATSWYDTSPLRARWSG